MLSGPLGSRSISIRRAAFKMAPRFSASPSRDASLPPKRAALSTTRTVGSTERDSSLNCPVFEPGLCLACVGRLEPKGVFDADQDQARVGEAGAGGDARAPLLEPPPPH